MKNDPIFASWSGPRNEPLPPLYASGTTASRAPDERTVNSRRTLRDAGASTARAPGHRGSGPYYRVVNPIGAAVVALVVGLSIGALLVWAVFRSRRADPAPTFETADPVVPAGVTEVLAVLNSAGVVVGSA